MSYTVLARKYRPRTFADVVGQEHAVRALTNALDSGRLHHAYLLTGTRGVGKTTIARILANCFNCDVGKPSEPCGECSTCLDFAEGSFLDLYEVDAASRTGVDDTRQLLDNVQYLPTSGKVKVYLIDEVHMLSPSSFNALLLTLEEPPEHVKFILATTDPKKIPVTVLSRCLQFHLKNIAPDLIAAHLAMVLEKEGFTADEGSLSLISRAADGSMRDALSLTDQAISHGGGTLTEEGVSNMIGAARNEEVQRLLELLADEARTDMLDFLRELGTRAVNYPDVLASLMRAIHNLVLAQASDAEPEPELAPFKSRFSAEWLQLAYQILLMCNRDLKYAPDPRTGFEMAIIRVLDFEPMLVNEDSPSGGGTAKPAPEAPQRASVARNQGSRGPRADAVRPSPPPRNTKSQTTDHRVTERNADDYAKAPAVTADASRNPDALSKPWELLLKELRPSPELRSLLEHSQLLSREQSDVQLRFPSEFETALDTQRMDEIENLFIKSRGKKTKVQIDFGAVQSATPADLQARKHQVLEREQAPSNNIRERRRRALEEIERDPVVQQLKEVFNAKVANVEFLDEKSQTDNRKEL